MSFAAKYGIENEEQLAHAGAKCWLGALAPGPQPQIEGSDGRIAADGCDREKCVVPEDVAAAAEDPSVPRGILPQIEA